ncbi:MAG: branched-chain amino acid ABC transporter ATP-binding protein/permease [Pseudomonadales bacterium]|jgi:branched-chain amino acid transport system permease protein|tara:strand:- start:750 stop:2513 length:1764 start_codon:yes stop_codon:yes gene_type:complete
MVSSLVQTSLLILALCLVPVYFSEFASYQLGLFLIYGLAAQSVGWLWGKTNILSLGQALFFGGAAYSAAMIMRYASDPSLQGLFIIMAIVIIALLAFLLASLVFQGSSDSGAYFSLITLALVMIMEQVVSASTEFTGGFNGFSGYPVPDMLDPFGNLYYIIVIATTLITGLLLYLNTLPADLVLRALADNEPRMQLFGFATYTIKAIAFATSAIIAAVAGVLFAFHQGIVTPSSTSFTLSAELVIFAAVGGRIHPLGPLIGAVGVGWLTLELRDSFAYWELLIAIVFIVIVLRSPGGLISLLSIIPNRLNWRVKSNKHPTKNHLTINPPLAIKRAGGALKFQKVGLTLGVVNILNEVNFTTPEAGVLCLIGPNGAGKTSAFNLITGQLPTTSGSISFAKNNIHSRPTYLALNAGIGRKMQVPSIFPSLSIDENMTVATLAQRAKGLHFFQPKTCTWRTPYLVQLQEQYQTLLPTQGVNKAGELPQGHKQLLEFIMTICAEPALLLLDEPCAGLSQNETQLMIDLVKHYQEHKQGLIIIIEHDMSIVEALAEEVLVLHQGSLLASGSYNSVKLDVKVQAVYAGGTKVC